MIQPRSRRRQRKVAVFFPYQTKRMATDPQKREAARAVKQALTNGTLKKQPCETCGARHRIEAHHEDYDQPLSIRWLCRYHHRHRDLELRPLREAALASRQDLRPKPPTPREIFIAGEGRRKLLRPSTAALVTATTLAIADAMESGRVNESQIASRIGSSRQYVNTIFGGGVRTLATLATLADAIGCSVRFELVPNPDDTEAVCA